MANGTFNCEVIFSSNKASVQSIVNNLQKEVDKVDLGSKAGQTILKQFEKIKQKQAEMAPYEANATELGTSDISRYLSLTKAFSTAVNSLVNSFQGLSINNGLMVSQDTLTSLQDYDLRIQSISRELKKLGPYGPSSATVGSLTGKEQRNRFSGGKQSPYKENTTKTTLGVALSKAQQRAADFHQQQTIVQQEIENKRQTVVDLENQKAALPKVENIQIQTEQGKANLQKFLEQAIAQREANAEKVKQVEDLKAVAKLLPSFAAKAVAKAVDTPAAETVVATQEEAVATIAESVAETTAAETVATMVVQQSAEKTEPPKKKAKKGLLEQIGMPDLDLIPDEDKSSAIEKFADDEFDAFFSGQYIVPDIKREKDELPEELQQVADQRYEKIVQSLLESDILKVDTEGNAANGIKRNKTPLFKKALAEQGFSQETIETIVNNSKDRLALIQEKIEQQVLQQSQSNSAEQATQAVEKLESAIEETQTQVTDTVVQTQIAAQEDVQEELQKETKTKSKKKEEPKVEEEVAPAEPVVSIPEMPDTPEIDQAISQAAVDRFEEEYQTCIDLLTDPNSGLLNEKGGMKAGKGKTKENLKSTLLDLDLDEEAVEKIVNTSKDRFNLIRQAVAEKIAKENEELAAQTEASTSEAAIKQQQKDAALAHIQTEFAPEEWKRIFNSRGKFTQAASGDLENTIKRVQQGMSNLGLDEAQISDIMGRSDPGNALKDLFQKMFANPEQYQQYFQNQTTQKVSERNAQEQRLTTEIENLNADITQKMADATALGKEADASEVDVRTLQAEMQKITTRQNTLQQQLEQLKAERKQIKEDIDKPQSGTMGQDAFKASLNVQGDVRQMYKDRKDEEVAAKLKSDAELEVERFQNNLSFGLKQWMGVTQVINLVRNGIREAYQDIKNLDQAMTNIAVVTDMSVDDLWGKIDDYMAIAQQYGVTTQGVYEVSQLFYQQGLGAADTMELTTETLKMARIANMDYAEAADAMTVA